MAERQQDHFGSPMRPARGVAKGRRWEVGRDETRQERGREDSIEGW